MKLELEMMHVDDVDELELELKEAGFTMNEIAGDDGTPIHLWFNVNELRVIVMYTTHEDELCKVYHIKEVD